MINHSCTPNCIQTFEGKNLAIRCVDAIKKGEEVTISYIDLAETRQKRRADLVTEYYFDIDDAPHMPCPLPCCLHSEAGPAAIIKIAGCITVKVYSECLWQTDDTDPDLTSVLLSGWSAPECECLFSRICDALCRRLPALRFDGGCMTPVRRVALDGWSPGQELSAPGHALGGPPKRAR